ncbi:MAG TPA: glycoside hydrolase family 28 protein, partial [Rhodothermales bacterium]|nr:glycoside hydrolase family 28 protein [Rhodothermales bacterium]
MVNRRAFLARTGTAALGVAASGCAGARLVRGSPDPWRGRDAVLARIRPPAFPDRTYRISDFGARGDGRSDAREATLRAIARCNADGGGRVAVPAGTWWMGGPLHLKSNVELHLEAGAVVRFTPDPARYLPPVLTRWEGTEVFAPSPFVYAYAAENVALTGPGTFDGNAAETFWPWRDRQRDDQQALRRMGADGVPVYERVFGEGHVLRPSFVQFFGCRNVLIDGPTFETSPFWVLHPVFSSNVTVRNVRVHSLNLNNDGVDVDSCTDVLIERCVFETGDDAVALKSGRDRDGWRVGRPTENVVVRDCLMRPRVNALTIGSEMSGGVRNVYVEHLRVEGEADSALYFKANLDRGGIVEDVFVRDVEVESARTLLHFTTDYAGYRGGQAPPTFRRFEVSDVTCARAGTALVALGIEAAPIEDVRLRRITVRQANETMRLRHVRGVDAEDVTVNGAPLRVPASTGAL